MPEQKISGTFQGGRHDIKSVVRDIDAQNARVKKSNLNSFRNEVNSIASYYHGAIYNGKQYKNVLPGNKTGTRKYGRATHIYKDGEFLCTDLCIDGNHASVVAACV